ncbi:hypothetical protein GCM10027566_05880 [Arachidicoccus ginsenosidivorans]|uniref:Lipoprotein n=1 Tax=Arachidicoccus ginsenosidivorans TaxID=496057 RepID=A0A5B8VTW8_9BACT|nr:hypothetical protein [Arachidicoccus ginsenosidivorans]QEC74035.1 hypothetical protein FSB73_22545 [Arachidicoccus ginsenosidivorans]
MHHKFLLKYYLLVLFMVGLFACHKEEPLVVSKPGTNLLYSLPQGDHPYDNDIVQFYHKYNCFILYKFDSVDYNYNMTGIVRSKLSITPADSNYIAQALTFMHKNLFDVYPESFLQKTMPFSILLSSEIMIDTSQVFTQRYYFDAYCSQRGISFGLVNDSFPELTTQQLNQARGWLNMVYWQAALANGHLSYPDGFTALSVPNNQYDLVLANQHKYGVLSSFFSHYFGPYDYTADFLSYIIEITSTDSTTFANTWLTPQVDINGLYKKKYELIINYYKTNYGINLQAIGDLKN